MKSFNLFVRCNLAFLAFTFASTSALGQSSVPSSSSPETSEAREVVDSSAPVIGSVEGATFRALPIAITDARVVGLNGGEVIGPVTILTKKVRADLAMTGLFDVLNPKSFIDTDGVVNEDVRFGDWVVVGAENLLKWRLSERKNEANKYELEVFLYDVSLKSLRFTKTYVVDKEKVHLSAHQVANDLFENLSQEPGVFLTRLAAVKRIAGAKHIVALDIDGENERQLTRQGGLNLLPSWSPKARSVLFTSYRRGNPDLFEVSLKTSKVKLLSNHPGLNTGGKVSPDNKTIALTLSKDGNSELYLLNRKGVLKRRLTNSWGIDTSADWSPDGQSLVFVSSRRAQPNLYLMKLSEKSIRRLTFQGDYHQTPVFSPRGDKIAFTARDANNRLDIFVLDLESNTLSRVTQDQGNNEEPSFAPNGGLLAFTSDRSGQKSIYITTLDGKVQTRVTRGGSYSSPAWGPFLQSY